MIDFYLAHPFDTRHDMRTWELYIESHYGVQITNPFYDLNRQDVLAIDEDRHSRYEKLNPAKIIQRDLDAIHAVLEVIAYIDGSLSYGTIMEIVYAKLFNRPVHAIVTNGHQNHPWLVHHAFKIYESLEEFEGYLISRH